MPGSRLSPLAPFFLLSLICGSLTPAAPWTARAAAQSAAPAAAVDSKTVTFPADVADIPGTGPIHTEERFVRKYETLRTKWAAECERDQGAVVFLGDSITEGWGERLARHFPGLKVANRGIGGDTTRGVLWRLEGDVLAVNPSAVVLLIGTNDIGLGATADVIAENFAAIIAALKQHNSELPIVVCQVFPSSEQKQRSSAAIQEVNQRYTAAVQGDPQITLLETWRLFASADGDAKVEEFPDLLHLNDGGYKKWAAALRPILATLDLIERSPEPFELEPGFRSLYNGRDLTGWALLQPKTMAVIESCDGKTQSSDGRYVALHDRIVVTTPAEGRRVQQLWTHEQFPGNFVLRLEFRATPYADSGVFIRKPQLQCRDYGLAGPFKDLQKYRPQEWNEMEVTVTDGVAHCTCNGEVLQAELAVPETGPLGLEGDRGQMEYRRIRIKTLP